MLKRLRKLKKLTLLSAFQSLFLSPGIATSLKDSEPVHVLKTRPLDIHLMWLNESKNMWDDFIFPDAKKDEVLQTLSGWINKNNNDKTTIHFWYDSLKTTPDAFQKTSQLITEQFPQTHCQLVLNDIRELEEVTKSPTVFDSTVPVYFQADLLRFVIAQKFLKEKEGTFLYADLNVTAEDPTVLFDEPTLNLLDKFGIVMLRNDQGPKSHRYGGTLGFENKFMMLKNDPQLEETIENYLVRPLIHKVNELDPQGYRRLTQTVYNFLPHMFKYLFWKKDFITLHQQTKTLPETVKPIFDSLKSLNTLIKELMDYKEKMDKLSNPPENDAKALKNYENKKANFQENIEDILEEVTTTIESLQQGLDQADTFEALQQLGINWRKVEKVASTTPYDALKTLKDVTQENYQQLEDITYEPYEEKPDSIHRFVIASSGGLEWNDLLRVKEKDTGRILMPHDLTSVTKHFYKHKEGEYNWPKELAIPFKRMTAPASHFG